MYKTNSGLAVFFYPEDKERVQFSGVKSEEGLSKFLVKNLGDSILVGFFLIQIFKKIAIYEEKKEFEW